MVALALSLGNVRTMPIGNRRQGTATLTMVASTSTYNNSGHDLPEGWAGLLGAPTKVEFATLDGPLVASTIDLTFAGKIDVTGGKLVIYGGATTAAEDKTLEELPNGASITNGTYTATLLVQGY